MEIKKPWIDLNYEEINCDRSISDNQFSNGNLSYSFNVNSSGGGACVPYMSYFLCEYNFGSATEKVDNYTATRPIAQFNKIALQNNFTSTLFTAARYTVAGSEIGVVNTAYSQLSTLQHRLKHTTSFIEHLGGDLNGFDPDFSRRLARASIDGVYHRAGLINCEPNNQAAAGPNNEGVVALYNQAELPLTNDVYYIGTACNTSITQSASIYPFMSRSASFNITSGSGSEIKSTDADLASAIVNSIQWTLPDYSASPGTPSQNVLVIDGTLIQKGDEIKFFFGNSNAQKTALSQLLFRVGDIRTVGSRTVLDLVSPQALVANSVILAFDASPIANSGIIKVFRVGGNPYSQAEPQCGVVNGMVAFVPPLNFFQTINADTYFGEQNITLTPNSNWQQAAVECPAGGYYGTDVKWGTDYCFGIKSIRLYLARVRLTEVPRTNPSFIVDDYQVSNKQLSGATSSIQFVVPPSTKRLVAWIQDSAVGTNSKLPLTRFKVRQYTGDAKLSNMNRYGCWNKTFDENLLSIQVSFCGTNKPMTTFIRGGSGQIGDNLTNSMLQRFIMTNQNNGDKQMTETFNDWLNCGAYYVFDFDRPVDQQGTTVQVNMTYATQPPSTGNFEGDNTQSNINLYLCSIYERSVALSYSNYGTVLSAQTQLR